MTKFDDTKSRIILVTGNVLPVFVSVLIYLFISFISQNALRFWVIYNALIVPLFLLTFNFIFERRAFLIWSLLVILGVELICAIIHMAYFQFALDGISLLIWIFMLGSAVAIIAIGGSILYFVSKKKRNSCKL